MLLPPLRSPDDLIDLGSTGPRPRASGQGSLEGWIPGSQPSAPRGARTHRPAAAHARVAPEGTDPRVRQDRKSERTFGRDQAKAEPAATRVRRRHQGATSARARRAGLMIPLHAGARAAATYSWLLRRG